MPIELVMLSNHLILSCLLLLLASIFPIIRFFLVSWLLALGGQDIGASASALVLPVNLQKHHSSKASILWCSAFIMVQLSHLHMTNGKTIALTIWTFVSKVMSLLFNGLSRFVIAFLPRSKHLLIPWLQSPSAMILEPKKSVYRECLLRSQIAGEAYGSLSWVYRKEEAEGRLHLPWR